MKKRGLIIFDIAISIILVLAIILNTKTTSKKTSVKESKLLAGNNEYSFDFVADVDYTKAKVGDTVAIKLSLQNLNLGEDGLNNVIGYLTYDDSVFEEVNIEGLGNWIFERNEDKNHEMFGKFVIYTMQEGVTTDQDVAMITAKVKSDLQPQTTKINITRVQANNGQVSVGNLSETTVIEVYNEGEKPDNPNNPDEPNNPDSPNNSDNSSNSNDNNSGRNSNTSSNSDDEKLKNKENDDEQETNQGSSVSRKTGDAIALVILILIIATIALNVIIICKKQDEEDEQKREQVKNEQDKKDKKAQNNNSKGMKLGIISAVVITVIGLVVLGITVFAHNAEMTAMISALDQGEVWLNSEEYLVTDETVSRIAPLTNIDEIKNKFNKEISIFEEGTNNQVTSGIVKTGMRISDGDNSYSVSVLGDINGDGESNQIELTGIIRAVVNPSKWNYTGVKKLSADMNVNGVIDEGDVSTSVRYILYGDINVPGVNEIAQVTAPKIEVVEGTYNEVIDAYEDTIQVKITPQDQNATSTKYKVEGTKIVVYKDLDEGEVIQLTQNGVYKISAYSYGAEGNRSEIPYIIVVKKNATNEYKVTTRTEKVDGTYEEVTEQKQGRIGQTVTVENTTPEGFSINQAQSTLSGVIRSEDEEELNLVVTYDRNEYTLTLNAGENIDGVALGNSVENVQSTVSTNVKYGKTAQIIAKVKTQEGYIITFDRWKSSNGNLLTDNANRAASIEMPIGNITLTAIANKVSASDTMYKVEYYYQEKESYKTEPDGSKIKNGETDTEVTVDELDKTPTRQGYVLDDSKQESYTATVAGNGSTVLKVYFKQQFTVTYKPGTHGTFTEQITQNLDYNEDTPEFSGEKTCEAGYKFAGWDKTVENKVTKTEEYTATWQVEDYTITYDLADGQLAEGDTNETGYNVETETFTLNNPTKTGYIFDGWSGTGIEGKAISVTISKGSTGNKTYTANWRPATNTVYHVKHYTENLEGNGYELNEDKEEHGTTGETATATAKTITGFTYDEDNTDNKLSETIAANGSTVLEVYYSRNTYTVTLTQDEDIDTVTGAANYKYGAQVTIKATPKTQDGYTIAFKEWETETTSIWQNTGDKNLDEVTFTMPAENVSIEATSTKEANTVDYKVEYYYQENGIYPATAGETNTVTRQAQTGTTVSVTTEDKTPAQTGYAYDENATGKCESDTVAGNGSTTLKLYFKQQFTVTYKPGAHGTFTEQTTQNLDYNEDTPEFSGEKTCEAGYKFAGWDKTVENKVTKTEEYKATWQVENYTITYDLADGQLAEGETNETSYNVETETFTLHNPTKTGYIFDGWSGTGIEGKAASVTITKGSTGDKTYTANWTPESDTVYHVKHYTENLEGDGYELNEDKEEHGTTGETATVTAKAITGFTFDSANANNKLSETIAADGSTVLEVYYSRDTYTLTLEKDENIDSTTGAGDYKYGAQVTINATLKSEIGKKITFTKWETSDATLVPEKTTQEATFTMPAGNIELTAKSDIAAEYGQNVNYSVTVNNQVLDNWRLFMTDEDGYAYLIYGDYFPNAAISEDAITQGHLTTAGTYRVWSTTNRTDMLNAMKNTSNWDNLITSEIKKAAEKEGKTATATASPTMGQLKKSWNDQYTENGQQITISGNETNGWGLQRVENTKGYKVTENNMYFPRKSEFMDGDGEAWGYWLSSIGNRHSGSMMNAGKDGNINNLNSYDGTSGVFRPLIRIPVTLLEKNSDGQSIDIAELSVSAYHVEHYLENLNSNDSSNPENYTLEATEEFADDISKEVTASSKTFAGFDFDETNSNNVLVATVANDRSTVLKVFYTRKSYEVEITNDENIDSATGAGTYKYGATVNITATPKTEAGYTITFARWETENTTIFQNEAGRTSATTSFTMPAEKVVLQATGTKTANTYYIQFNANGGTGSMENQTMTYDTSANLIANNYTRDKHYFIGWNTEADGSGTGYEDEQSVLNLTATNEETIILYAQWKEFQTVKYAVQIYGINQDVDKNDNPIGLTFGPATGENYNNSYVTHEYEETSTGSNIYNVKIVTHTVAADGTETTSSQYLKNSSNNNVTRTAEEKEKYNVNMHEMTWSQIKAIPDKTVFTDCMLCGDTKSVELTMNRKLEKSGTYTQYGDGAGAVSDRAYSEWNPKQAANAAIGTGVSLSSSEKAYGSNARNAGGYSTSHIRATLIGADKSNPNTSYAGDDNLTSEDCWFSCIESDLQDAITPKKIRYVTGTSVSSYTVNEDIADSIWLFSQRELNGSGQNSGNNAEGLGINGTAYDRFENNNSKYRNLGNSGRNVYNEFGNNCYNMTRSIFLNDIYVWYVHSSGQIYSTHALWGMDIGFGFCIGTETADYKVEKYYQQNGEYPNEPGEENIVTKNGAIGLVVTATDEDKTPSLEGYAYDEDATEKVESAEILEDGTTTLKLYFKQRLTVTYNLENIVYGLDNCSETNADTGFGSGTYLKYSITDQVVTAKGVRSGGDCFGITSIKAYLEAGKEYSFSCTTDSVWATTEGSYEDNVEAFWWLNSSNYCRMETNENCKFTPSVTGEYSLRLDVNKYNETHTFSNISINEVYETVTKDYNANLGTLPTATKDGYTLKGWYTEQSGGIEATEDTVVTENKVYYAQWEKDNKVKYAVQIYGINQDEDIEGNTLGLTFGPATGMDYTNKYITHTYQDNGDGTYNVMIVTHTVAEDGTETTETTNLKKSSGANVTRTAEEKAKYDIHMHEMTWTEIKAVPDKTVFRDCMLCGDTKPVEINVNDTLKGDAAPEQYGDGSGMLYSTIKDIYRKRNQLEYATSRIRAVLIGKNSNTAETSEEVTQLTENISLYGCIDNELRNVITAKKIKNRNIADKIWLFSIRELYGPNYSNGNEGLGTQNIGYARFSDTESRYYLASYTGSQGSAVQRECFKENGRHTNWQTRSYNGSYMTYIGDTGGIWDTNTDYTGAGIAFGFCITSEVANYKIEKYYQQNGEYPDEPGEENIVTKRGAVGLIAVATAEDKAPSLEDYVYDENVAAKVESAEILADGTTTLKLYFKQQFTVTFDSNGGEALTENTKILSYGEQIGELPTASKNDLVFMGWYDSASGGNKISKTIVPDANVTYYAHYGSDVNIDDVSIGDTIAYIPSSKSYTVDNQYAFSTGDGTQTLTNEGVTEWKVLRKEENNVLIVPSSVPNAQLQLQGAQGYNNGVYLLDDACSELFGNEQLGITARSVKEEDFVKAGKRSNSGDDENTNAWTRFRSSFVETIAYGRQSSSSHTTYKDYPTIYEQELNSVVNDVKNTSPNALGNSESPENLIKKNDKGAISGKSATDGCITATTSIHPYQTEYYPSSYSSTKGLLENDAGNVLLPEQDTTAYFVATRSITSYYGDCEFKIGRVVDGKYRAIALRLSFSHSSNANIRTGNIFPVVTIPADLLIQDEDGNIEKANKSQYKIECYYQEDGAYPEQASTENTIIKYGYAGSTATATDEDKTPSLEGYVYDSEATGKIESAIIESDGTTTLKLYFKQ